MLKPEGSPVDWIRPMEPVLHPEPFDDAGWAFQLKWDGVRILAYVDGAGGVRLINRRGNERTAQYPEVVAALREQLGGAISSVPTASRWWAVLDGEMVAMAGGKPDFPTVMRRDRANRPGVPERMAAAVPVTYALFDLLIWNGRDWTAQPFAARTAQLRQALQTRAPLLLTDTVWGQGRALFAAVQQRGLEGIVAKRASSPYRAGEKHRDWLKVKAFRQDVFPVGGLLLRGHSLASLLLGRWENGVLRYAGRVGSLTQELSRELLAWSESALALRCPFQPPPPVRDGVPRWLEPQLAARVEFLEWTEDGQLRHPRLRELTPQ